jgi:hypothetical protein
LAYGFHTLKRRGRMTPTGITPSEAKKLSLNIHMTPECYKKYTEHEMLER